MRTALALPDHRADLALTPKRLLSPDIGHAMSLRFDYEARGQKHCGIGCWKEPVHRGLAIIASLDITPHGTLLHVSLSYPHRLPGWDDVTLVRARFFPEDADVAMVLPRREDYINVHQYTFHLTEMPVAWGIR